MSALPGASLLAAAAETALNTAIAGSSAARADLKRLDGKVIQFKVTGLPLTLHFLPQAERLTVAADYHGEPDIRITAPAGGLLAAALKRDDAVPRGMEISGDAETAQLFSRLLKQADPDWEEVLSRYIGDIPARQVGNLLRGIARWSKDAGSRLGQDLADYLHYETRAVPPRHEVEQFLTGVDRLRDDAERLAARLDRAARKAGRP